MITKSLMGFVESAHAACYTTARELAILAQKEENADRKHHIITLRNKATNLAKEIEALYK